MHESDAEVIAIPFEVRFDFAYGVSDLTTPGLALGAGQLVDIDRASTSLSLEFDLSNGQYINLSEVVHLPTA